MRAVSCGDEAIKRTVWTIGGCSVPSRVADLGMEAGSGCGRALSVPLLHPYDQSLGVPAVPGWGE